MQLDTRILEGSSFDRGADRRAWRVALEQCREQSQILDLGGMKLRMVRNWKSGWCSSGQILLRGPRSWAFDSMVVSSALRAGWM
jgi:hypothetical protein